MPDKEPENPATRAPDHPNGPSPATARWQVALWWLFGGVCLVAAIGSFLKGNTLSAPCYLIAAAVSLPPVARILPWKIPDNWKYFLILAGLMGAALLAGPPDSPHAPQDSIPSSEQAPEAEARHSGNNSQR